MGRVQSTTIINISIHALRTEGDTGKVIKCSALDNFYPRPPYGGRHNQLNAAIPVILFLSTPSVRRATFKLTIKAHR